ncbi:SDR family NAD(P)-dependent oxidoreductase [Cognatishimia maritima]|uniref:2-deoxy-D-gluconate 3-dehydrogenase n=1 Tax=Cognatishimia maritima TaxID=870908 RepID=A0A1M5NXK4_9RHOB|nr:SDR family oxidoreductase [Cognatishimia maritima]SHG94251.1 2-deoxy-D-gluconate 3-dehydrogenase [Cognatishimia maritima]
MTNLPKTPSFDLSGKKVLVTGASSGIGLGCAVAVAEAGAQTYCAARGLDRLTQAVEAMQAAGYSAETLPMDQSDIEAMSKALAEHAFDVVVNSAGIARHSAAIETTPEDYDAVMHINLRSAYFLSAQAAKAMIDAGKPGSIIHISSQMGHTGGIDRALYCAGKHGLEGMIKSMAMEWGKQRIRINSICPTFIRTPFTEATFSDPERLAWIMQKIKLDRVGEVEDIMGAVQYLASDASAMVTGTSLLIDGGWTAG